MTIVLYSFTMTCCFRGFLNNLKLKLVEILQISKFKFLILLDRFSRIAQILLKFTNVSVIEKFENWKRFSFEKYLKIWHAFWHIDKPNWKIDTLSHWHVYWHVGKLARKNEKLSRFWHVGMLPCGHVGQAGTYGTHRTRFSKLVINNHYLYYKETN